MKDLQDLVKIITRPKLKTLQIFGADVGSGSTKLSEFYNLISDGIVDSDDAAAQHFYQKDKSFPAYQKLRKTFKDRLVTGLFLIDLKKPSYNERQKAYYECYREWAAAKILFGKQANSSALTLSAKLLKIAKKFEFTELVVDIAHTFRLYYGTIEGDFKKYTNYNKIFKTYEELWMIENRSEEYYTNLSIGFVNSKSNKEDSLPIARSYAEELEEYLDKYDSYQLHLCGRLVLAGVCTLEGDKEKLLKVCQDAIEFFSAKKYEANIPLQVFYYEMLVCYFQKRDFDGAIATAAECERFLENGTFNWFKLQELYVLCYFHLNRPEEVSQHIDLVFQHNNFKNLPTNIQEFWKIARSYLWFEKYAREKNETVKEELQLMVGDLELFLKDKGGMNIPILVLKILIKVLNKDHDDLVDSVDRINQYRKRYLLTEENQRSNIFVKTLLLIPRRGFQKKHIEEEAITYLGELQKLPLEMSNQAHQLEVIPYEDLWEIVLSLV